MNTLTLGKRLAGLLEETGWSHAHLGTRLGVGRIQIWNYLNDHKYPRHGVLVKIARLLRTPVGKLYGETAGRTVPASKKAA